MSVQILETLRTLGVTVEVIGPDRLRLEPASKIPPELVSLIRQAKPQILEALKKHECGPECYSIRDGKRIHRPWSERCQAKIEKPVPRQIERTCWHCQGSGHCKCFVCAEALPGGFEAECGICRGTGKALIWVH